MKKIGGLILFFSIFLSSCYPKVGDKLMRCQNCYHGRQGVIYKKRVYPLTDTSIGDQYFKLKNRKVYINKKTK